MREFFVTAASIPVLVLVYAGTLVRGLSRRSVVLAIVALGVTGILISTAVRPVPATGKAPTTLSAIDPATFSTLIQTGRSPSAPVVITFSTAMNMTSVGHMFTVEPAAKVGLAWNSTATILTITPADAWSPGTFHTVTVAAGALDATGRPLGHAIRSVFLTRAPYAASITASAREAGYATSSSHFLLAFTGPIDPLTVQLEISPNVPGSLATISTPQAAQTTMEFTPSTPLPAGLTFHLSLAAGARDADGAAVESTSTTVRTAAAPKVVRFRPADGATGIGWSQVLSVRFTESMDRATTQKAWSAKQGSSAIGGTFSWAENDAVLVFTPKATLGYGQKVTMTVAVGALSRAGVALSGSSSATFSTAPRPSTPKPVAITSSGGGSVGSSTWAAVEGYYLKLMNCTRTGGWVTSTGSCSSPGGRNVAPLWQDAGISAKVSRPYAKKLVDSNQCTHFYGGTPGDRLAAAGYTNYTWAENLGCLGGDPYASMLSTQLYFQSEGAWSPPGGHYVNMMNAAYDRAGIGVWIAYGRLRVVIDFYHP